ncbi:SCO family protein [Gluconacetobacter entanii]|uniref:SCO family protein n=1 Tax=Gluconacetobacter entanii TaxID=108528 RepID=UPI001C931E5B|nr:SCO family protein [Gluconacetobacter entanii]MBY4641355.1 SCO family protein [Gluconacetobacter entanii]MCW4581357.1 SCO family protein [Gluconacetobacter entanii]MCW4584803.1 SCO family protein [Gluconacetobacter entanii]MCW4588217.1 SCO family protein [Gluconacetobacter entanii]
MMGHRAIRYAMLAIVLACIAPAWRARYADAKEALQALAFTPRQGTALPLDTPFTDTSGQTRPLGAFLGHGATIVSMGYYACPNMCELERRDLLDALARGGLKTPADYTLLVVSIDPAETRIMARQALEEDLARSADPGAGQGWHFVTGAPASIQRLSRAVGFHARYDEKLHQYLHPMGLVFITPAGIVSGYVLGIGYRPGDIRQALSHAARGEQARAVPILLLCFHYDETTGRYTLAVEKLLKLGAGLTVLTLGTLLGMAHWRGQR